MAGASLLTLLDDVATLLDDVATMTKVATKKTAGVLGDDLALNAEQVSGIRADRELPVVWAVARGSMINKAILVPAALLISALVPMLITPLLMLGGAFLCYEGVEKVLHKFLHGAEEETHHREKLKVLANADADLVAFERERIKGAVRTDFILSAEIIVITLGAVQGASLGALVAVLVAIAVLMTVGVYGLVAMIVKLDDAGLHLLNKAREGGSAVFGLLGRFLLRLAPKLMKFLAVAGTIAMFTVGGSILMHGLPGAHHVVEWVMQQLAPLTFARDVLHFIVPILMDILLGIIAGALVLLAVGLVKKVLPAKEGEAGSA